MPASLDAILAATRQRLSLGGKRADMEAMERAAAVHSPRGFRRALQRRAENGLAIAGIAIIAELKKASPSKGLIRGDFKPSELASDLERAGAAALSVLTDEQFFQGSLNDLRQASGNSSLPCLRKDFIVDEVQIVEARANCADAILLIVAALEQKELVRLAGAGRAQGLDVLCETHDEDEVRRALDAGCDLIGVNSRDLRTFEVKLDTALRLAEKIPGGCVRVAESGIQTGADIARLRAAGYDAFLIGESLMKKERPGAGLARLMEEARMGFCEN
jgi:indole-3-glycerol phosphate synthase